MLVSQQTGSLAVVGTKTDCQSVDDPEQNEMQLWRNAAREVSTQSLHYVITVFKHAVSRATD